ncbi:MAG TPA: response regulator [Candidatus Nanoarchaeia archaeon]|nr:response regulator [Candidatus Nanoarchaeia archaeon]
MSLLLVDDTVCILNVCKRFLNHFNIPYVAFDSCDKALEYYVKNSSGIVFVLTDVEMISGINGVELTSQLKTINDKLPVYVMSGRADFASEAIKLGADKFFYKDNLMKIIQSVASVFPR